MNLASAAAGSPAAVRRAPQERFSGGCLARLVPVVIPGAHASLPQKAVLAAEIALASQWVQRRMREMSIADVVPAIGAEWRPVVGHPPEDAYAVALQTARVVGRALDALSVDTRCLSQSLVLLCLLSRRGINATLVIGARSDPQFGAHAWVEHEGQAVLAPLGFADARLLEIPVTRA